MELTVDTDTQQPSDKPKREKIITVRVGKDPPVDYTIEEAQLTRSVFFENALKWRKLSETTAEEGFVDLTDEEPAVFILYAKWLQSDYLSIPYEPSHLSTDEILEECRLLCSAYIFAETYQCTDFQDAVMDALQNRGRVIAGYFLPDLNLIWKIFENTSKSSPLRRLVADLYVWSYGDDWRSDLMYEHAHVDFYYHIALALRRRLNAPLMKPPFDAESVCTYHFHPLVGETCYKEKMVTT